MELYESREVLGDFFRLTYVENPGAAFSLGFESDAFNRIFFSVLTFIMLFFILYLLRQSKHILEKLSFSLMLGGAIGNLTDRLIFGSVTDFFDFEFFNIFGLERWPIFNIADSSVVVAVFILLYYTIFIEMKKNSEFGIRSSEFRTPNTELQTPSLSPESTEASSGTTIVAEGEFLTPNSELRIPNSTEEDT